MLTSLSKTKGSIFRFFEIMKITAETNTNILAIRRSGGTVYGTIRLHFGCMASREKCLVHSLTLGEESADDQGHEEHSPDDDGKIPEHIGIYACAEHDLQPAFEQKDTADP